MACDEEGEVVLIAWGNISLSGNLSWTYFPSSVRYLYLRDNRLGGLIEFPAQSLYLEIAELQNNQFAQSLALNELSDSLTRLDVSVNRLDGECTLHYLPSSLESLNLSHNLFTGGVYLNLLPIPLGELFLSYNALGCSLDLLHLPPFLERLHLNDNSFIGKPNVSELPTTLTELRMERNFLWGPIFISDLRLNFTINPQAGVCTHVELRRTERKSCKVS